MTTTRMFSMHIARFAATAVSALFMFWYHGAGAQQNYPSKQIRIIVPFTAGGLNDFAGRSISDKLAQALGVPVVVDNRPGAGGTIGAQLAAQAPPDGYTLIAGSVGTHAINQSLYKKLPYDVLHDFVPVTLIANAPNILVVHPSLPAKSVKELIALAKARPGQLNFASGGNGTSPHLAGEMFKAMAKVDMVHVAYKGAGLAVIALMGGHVTLSFPSMPGGLPLAKAGKLRALAVTGRNRSPSAPELSTIAEAGIPGYEVNGWSGMFTPAGTPREIVDRLAAETVKILRTPEMKKVYLLQGAEPGGNTPDEFAAFVKAEIAKWKKVVEFSGARAD